MSDRHPDLLIRGGIVVTGHALERLDVAVTAGRVSALLAPGSAIQADDIVDAEGCYVLPGGIDTHTHVSWPLADGTRTDDGFTGAGRAAALGGTTTLVDFVPPLRPDQRLIDAAEERIAEVESGCAIDVALHPILNRADKSVQQDISKVIGAGLTSFKMYTTYDDRVNDGQIWTLMQEIVAHGGLPGFHAENHDVLTESLHELVEHGRIAVPDFPGSRPALAEATAIKTVSHMARALRSPVYIFHVSGAEAFDAVLESRRAGAVVHAETCTHYLAFDDSVFSRSDGWKFIITPPIRGRHDNERLWEAIADRTMTSVGSDHCAYSLASKSAHPDDHRLTPPGAAGIQARTPVLWDQCVNRRGLTPSDFVAISAESAAKALGLYPAKGTIAIGSDADLVVLDPARQWSGKDLPAASSNTFDLYTDYIGRGMVEHVFVRGIAVVRDANYDSSSTNAGSLLRRSTR
ncbi:dihydropyrimidinase [Rhodococcus wratislaviensis]|uniref:Allantoinase n=1 Tax=Rhodococcus wratislaviensis TaxID=44752 RepID=A0AB38FDY6_RHOWR|nr:amidohydrolase family protein [Rhodococcus wratislaviensis]REE75454.1 dihydropyrimidinase [Rhodococcus wratislaviensis]SPZ39512.1 allantoinase [Rhodococcus wratislaviensis]